MSERLGYIITVIVAALGWLVTYYVDRITSSPTIEYVTRQASDGQLLSVTFRLANISRTHSFENLDVHFLPRPNSPICAFDIVPVEPASEGANAADWGRDRARFTIERLMPGGAVDFNLKIGGPLRPRMYVQSGTAVRLTTANFETWLVRNEMSVVGGLIIFWVLALLFIVPMTLNYERKKEAAAARAARPTSEGG